MAENKNKTKTSERPLSPARWRPHYATACLLILGGAFSWFLIWQAWESWAATWQAYLPGHQPGVTTATAVDDSVQVAAEELPRLVDGIVVPSDQARFWPYAVMIENLQSVRPQSGLSQAAVVYETLAEGGSTRFMAVFDPSETIPEIMPVRSARPYYLEWASEFGALYAHAGGSPKALTVIRETSDFNNLEALSSDGKYFWRDRSKSAPHNLVTSSEKMIFALRDKNLLDRTADFSSWVYTDEAAVADRGADGKTVVYNFSSGATYLVEYTYDQAKNLYARNNAGVPHLDKNTNQQLTAKNVIVQIVREPELDGTGKGRLDIYVGGEGKAWVFRDGLVFEGVWRKASRTDRTRFYDAEGQEISLNRGNTWVAVIPETQGVEYR